jgi:hypothetical protein
MKSRVNRRRRLRRKTVRRRRKIRGGGDKLLVAYKGSDGTGTWQLRTIDWDNSIKEGYESGCNKNGKKTCYSFGTVREIEETNEFEQAKSIAWVKGIIKQELPSVKWRDRELDDTHMYELFPM